MNTGWAKVIVAFEKYNQKHSSFYSIMAEEDNLKSFILVLPWKINLASSICDRLFSTDVV